MRALRVASVASALVAFALLSNCGKKSAPTAPPDPAPQCAVHPTPLVFGDVMVGGHTDRTLTVSNIGGGILAGAATTSSAGYSVISGASYSLGAGQEATVTVRFSPTTTGSHAKTVTLSGTGCGSVPCSGNAVAPGPVCSVSPGNLSFVPIAGACASVDRSFMIRNTGTGTLSGTVRSTAAAFQIVGSPAYSLGSGQADTVHVRFSPGGYGSFTGWILTGCDSVFCSGSITRESACGVVAPDVLDFGTVYVGQTVTMGATLTAGSMPFELQWGSQGDPNFDGPSGVQVQANDSFSCQVDFTPQTEGQHTAWFAGQCRQLYGGDGGYHPFACITARGIAVAAPGTPTCQLSSTNLNFGTVAVGSFSERTLTVTNVGGGVLNGAVQPSGCPEFVVQQDPKVSLGPGQSKTYTIRLTPSQAGHAYTCYAFVGHPYCSMVTFSGQGQ